MTDFQYPQYVNYNVTGQTISSEVNINDQLYYYPQSNYSYVNYLQPNIIYQNNNSVNRQNDIIGPNNLIINNNTQSYPINNNAQSYLLNQNANFQYQNNLIPQNTQNQNPNFQSQNVYFPTKQSN